VVILALLVSAGAVLIAGSKPKLPPLFGPARNGAVIYGDAGGDIRSLDPATGKAVTIIGGSSDDRYPTVSPDGQRLTFVRIASPDMVYSSNIDGSDIQAIAPAKDAGWSEWSPDSKRLVYIADGGGTPFIRDVTTGTTHPLAVSSPVYGAEWLTDQRLLLEAAIEPGTRLGTGASRAFWTINADGTDQRQLLTPDACCGANVLPGRNLLAWTSWGLLSQTQGRIHVFDVASGKDRILASTQKGSLVFLDGRFSPDGNWLLVKQFGGTVTGLQPAIIAADGSGDFVPIGPELPKNDSELRGTFSPDGKQLLITYDDGSAWLYAIPGGEGTKVDWTGVVNTSWQRLALP
jgi:Tol biopolymer transport system component